MSPNRKEIDSFGKKGRRNYVRIVRERAHGKPVIRVLWKDPHRLSEPFEDSRNGLREARAYAEAKHESLSAPVTAAPIEPITLRQVFERYVTANVDAWADNTLRLRRWRWAKFEFYAGRDMLARDVTREHLDGFKRAMLQSHAPNQVRQAIKEITGVFRWAVDRDLIPPTKVTNYTTGFKKQLLRTGPKMAEYSRDERDRLVAALDPRNSRQWRAWALNVLFAECGPRQHAARHLEITDIELAAPEFGAQGPVFRGRIHWREETNKTGEDWWQPMPHDVAEAFWVCLGWRQAIGYAGRYLFPAGARAGRGETRTLRAWELDPAHKRVGKHQLDVGDRPYTYAALNAQLHAAERRAGVESIKYGAAHRHRRGVAGDVHAATGSEKAAADWIGDRSIKVVHQHYLLGREEELQKTAALFESGAKRIEMQRETKKGSGTTPEPSNHPLGEEPAVGIEPTTARSDE
jgi:hypothetical protein